ncbi:hypothetical protein HY04AAS1_0319 [Hydrogenobaculum sp. Y04AAS1]|uniref:hypothetical protein n=1 Tax=Hydrogenobaculum sp. (strain Y04AAS1) TaxID=380749 RepID=UPI00015BD066|nr:hypothetical protein HY04AAS1_0319 [Hydrogenobaculum sp. Y04AAS1]HCT66591.1 hypothetical protein [Hydrogenobaculum sp.]
MDGKKLKKRMVYGALGLLSLAVFAPKSSFAIPSFARQTGLACDVCHTVFPHLTPFGREFKLHGFTYDYSDLIKMVRQAAKKRAAEEGGMPNLVINKIPMIAVRIAGMWANQDGGSVVPHGRITDGQGAFSQPAGYPTNDTFNLVKDDSLYIAGEITPHLGAWVEIGGWNDHGDAASLAGYDAILNGGDHTVDNKNFTYGLSFENVVGFDDVGQAGPGNWGVPLMNPLSTHGTLFDPFNGTPIEGVEAYAMLGDFTNGGIYGNIGLYAPSTGNDEGTNPVATAGSLPASTSYSWAGAKHVDAYVNAEYWLPGFKNIYSMVGAFGYFGQEKMEGGTNPYEYSDNVNDYGLEAQAQYIGGKNLVEFFGEVQKQHDSEFYGEDYWTGQLYSTDGTSVNRTGIALKADYYYKRTYGVYVKYMYANSSQVQDVDYSGYIVGVSWYPWQNVSVKVERMMWSKYHPGQANPQYNNGNVPSNGSAPSASDFDVTAVKVEYLF